MNIDAVYQVIDFEPGEEGLFQLPSEVVTLEELTTEKGAAMKTPELDVRVYVEQMALLLNLPIKDEYRDGVVANFEKIKAIAQLVNSFSLPEDIEAAPVFEP